MLIFKRVAATSFGYSWGNEALQGGKGSQELVNYNFQFFDIIIYNVFTLNGNK